MSDDSSKPTILAVDDTPENLDVVKGILVPEYVVKVAINGPTALKIAESQPPDLILLDIMMPEMDGYEVCRRLKENPATREIPVIFLTAKEQTTDETRGFDLGAVDYIRKPVNPQILEARSRTQIALKRSMDDLQDAYEVIKRQKDRMQEELSVGHDIQMSMLPLRFPAFPERSEFEVFASLTPAREVGGDFYDFFFLNEDELCFCVGDVSGKGVPAALFMAVGQTLIKARALDDPSPASIVTRVNEELSEDNPSCMFITLWLGILDLRTGKLRYTNAGHNRPYILSASGEQRQLVERHGPVLGAISGVAFREDLCQLEREDVVFVYTDGLTEAMDEGGDLYSDPRLTSFLGAVKVDSMQGLVEASAADVASFEAGAEQADDLTILALQLKSEPGGEVEQVLEKVLVNQLPEIDRLNKEFNAFADANGVPVTVARRINLVFDELLNNTISYGFQDELEHRIHVRVGLTGQRLSVLIEDDGMPFNPFVAETPDTALSLQQREIGGLGIHLVREVMNEYEYLRRVDRNVVRLVAHLPDRDSAASASYQP
jgi:sigma-B regulation protein RsbU (phosphoserine phosphatase)